MSQEDSALQRIRDSLARLTRTPVRTTEPYQETERHVRESIRQLSRARISQLLRQLRATHGLSYAQVQANTGLTQQLLFDVEYGDRRLTLDQLRRLAECYHVSVEDLLGIDMQDD